MESIKSLINKETNHKGIERYFYGPYNLNIAKHVWFGLVKKIFKIDESKTKFIPGDQQSAIWNDLIKYTHGDEATTLDLKKGVCLIGKTGSGKTLTMEVLNEYVKIDSIVYKRDNKHIPFKFRIVTAREIVSDYMLHGYDGIAKYLIIGNLCIDDLGTEMIEPQYYGNKLDVISEVIEIRFNKGFMTHYTSNLNSDLILERYNSRVHSRILHQCNMITMNDKDFRI